MGGPRINIDGQRFGILIAVRRDANCRFVYVKCDCGSPEKRVRFLGLRNGSLRSCGCRQHAHPEKVRIDSRKDVQAFRDRACELLNYDPDTGVFTWKQDRRFGARAGDVAGHDRERCVVITVDGKARLAHRLAWLMVTGSWPKGVIDHRDGDFRNNRFANLRDVTPLVNTQNQRRAMSTNSTGLLGVVPTRSGRYRAKIKANGRYIHLGHHESPEAAHEAYITAKRVLHEGCTL